MKAGIHALVWIDASEAKIVSVHAGATGEVAEGQMDATQHHRSRSASREGHRSIVDHVFYQRVANDLADTKSFMVIGPADAKTEFVKHLHCYDPQLFPRLSAVESADRMSDGQLLALARSYFEGADRMIPHPVGA